MATNTQTAPTQTGTGLFNGAQSYPAASYGRPGNNYFLLNGDTWTRNDNLYNARLAQGAGFGN